MALITYYLKIINVQSLPLAYVIGHSVTVQFLSGTFSMGGAFINNCHLMIIL